MNIKHHFGTTFICLFILWLFSLYFDLGITITSIIVALTFCLFPDFDLRAGTHRNFLAHSITIWIIVFAFNPSIITVMMCVGTGFHCIEDIRFRKSKMRGYYTIKLIGNKQLLSGYLSTLYLIINFIISIILLGAWLVYV